MGTCEKQQILLEAKITAKRYTTQQGDVHAIQDIDLSLATGAFLGIYGPNGCGKTSLLRILAGLDDDFNGTVDYPLGRPKLGFAFQDYSESLFPWMTNLDNISYSLLVQGVGKKQRLKEVTGLLERVGLTVDLRSFPYQQSGGQQQLVGLLRAMLGEPALLILDEPFSSLDLRTTALARSALRQFRAANAVAMLFVSHELDEVLIEADEVLVMRRVRDHREYGSVIGRVHVPFPRPRDANLLETEDFHRVRSRVLSLLRSHSLGNEE